MLITRNSIDAVLVKLFYSNLTVDKKIYNIVLEFNSLKRLLGRTIAVKHGIN